MDHPNPGSELGPDERNALLARARRRTAVEAEPLAAALEAGAAGRDDNGIEANLHFKVCHGILTLRQAQTAEVAYKHKFG
jgi:hypothetical protein